MLLELPRACPTQKSLEVVSWGALTSAFAFLAPASCGRHEGLGLCWFGFGEFVILGRKPCSSPKDMRELRAMPGWYEAGSGTCCRRAQVLLS